MAVYCKYQENEYSNEIAHYDIESYFEEKTEILTHYDDYKYFSY